MGNISYMPSSDVLPNLFFMDLRILYIWCWSPSNCITVSTICSRIFGPASVPSLFMWPISIIGVPEVFANLSNLAAHSLTCDTLPAELSTSEVLMVCMESITTISGLTLLIHAKIFSNDVSQNIRQLSLGDSFILCALIFSWWALSSPLTYNTFLLIPNTVCSDSVLLPMPGSPPSSVSDPFTSPPPNTLLSSSSSISIRGSSVLEMSFMFSAERVWGQTRPFVLNEDSLDGPAATLNSLNEFHSPHCGHLPIHLGDSCPQLLQTYIVLSFAIFFGLL